MNAKAETRIVSYQGHEYQLAIYLYEQACHFTLRLNDPENALGGHWASAVFAPDANLKPNEVLVHDRPETPGMLKALEVAGIVRATGKVGDWLGIQLPIASLLIEPPLHLQLKIQQRVLETSGRMSQGKERLKNRETSHDQDHER